MTYGAGPVGRPRNVIVGAVGALRGRDLAHRLLERRVLELLVGPAPYAEEAPRKL